MQKHKLCLKQLQQLQQKFGAAKIFKVFEKSLLYANKGYNYLIIIQKKNCNIEKYSYFLF